jgi:hypothetical protein
MARLAYRAERFCPIALNIFEPARVEDNVLRNSNTFILFFVAFAGAASSACTSGGVGDPCIPEDEYTRNFPGYQATEVNVESQSFQCETRVCLVANFRGRVSCPYGQPDPAAGATGDSLHTCYIPGTQKTQPNQVTAKVDAWISSAPSAPAGRKPEQAVYCSCRCDGNDPNARYCDCPSGFICQKLVDDIGKGKAQLAGSYCIKEGTQVSNPAALSESAPSCQPPACGPAHPDAVDGTD